MRRAVYFDLETGGVDLEHPDIQLAAVAVDEATWEEVGSFETKIAFDPTKADPNALAMNHYAEEAWVGARGEAETCMAFAAFLNHHRSLRLVSKRGNPYVVAKLVGHNAANFDGPRLQRMFQRAGRLFLPADPRVRDTCQLAFWYFDARGEMPADFKLSTLCAHFGIKADGAHEALTDVRLCVQVARAILAASRVS